MITISGSSSTVCKDRFTIGIVYPLQTFSVYGRLPLSSFKGRCSYIRLVKLYSMTCNNIIFLVQILSTVFYFRQGVTIPGLGVFTFSQKKIDVGSNKFIVIQRPVFVLSEKFVQTHSLQYPKQHTSGQWSEMRVCEDVLIA